MDEKFDSKYEHQIHQLAQNRIETGNYKVFDYRARVITKTGFTDLVESERTDDRTCLVITNADGETVVITKEFGLALFNALKNDIGK